jgi:hypothetical protein
MDRERLRQVLGKSELAWIVDRARKKLARGEPLLGVIRLPHPSPAERDALRRLLGIKQLRGDGISVRLDDLDEILANSGVCLGLADAVAELKGPVSNLRQKREETAAAWTRIFFDQRGRWTRETEHPGLLRWLDALQEKGILSRIAEGDIERAE